MHLPICHWLVWPLQYALVKKSSCPSSPAACADARDQMVTSGSCTEPHPNSSLLLFLRLTSASALFLRHFLGANSKLNDPTDWNTELKMGRENPSFNHCTWPSSCHSSDWFCCNYPDRSVYYLLCDSLLDRVEEFLLWRPREKDGVPWSTVLLDRTNKQKKNQRNIFSCVSSLKQKSFPIICFYFLK